MLFTMISCLLAGFMTLAKVPYGHPGFAMPKSTLTKGVSHGHPGVLGSK